MMTKAELINFLENWENMSLLFNDRELARQHFPLLMEMALEGDKRYHWRASWAADKINEMIPGIAAPWIPELVEVLPRLTHSGKKRQFLKLISLYPMPEETESFLFEYCLDKMTSEGEDISIRVYSMQILYNISEKEPGLKAELLELIDREMEFHPTPGILTRGRKLAGRLRKEIRSRE